MNYFLGLDSGSTTTKAVIINETRKIVSQAIVPTGANSRAAINKVTGTVLKQIKITPGDIACTVSTGYGRKQAATADKQVTEITCHARGVNWLIPDARTIIDIGGQDFKIMALDSKGNVIDFRMNDKCAAGTGRFMEVMARVLELELDHFSVIALKAQKRVEITSVCTVFAETEVINHISSGTPLPDLANGIFTAVATRVYALARSLITSSLVVAFTGGVAQNIGMAKALEEKVGQKLEVPPQPQMTGAIGAALVAANHFLKQE